MEVYSRETFRDYRRIEGYDNYVISNYGEVFNIKSGKTKKPSIINRGGYYYVSVYKNSKDKKFLIHRLVAIHFIDNPEGKECVDHIDGNVLNNHQSNLRWATHKQNMYNRKLPTTNTSGHKGVYWKKDKNKWRASIEYDKKKIHIGYYTNIEDAITARREKARELFGEYLNDCEKDDE
jgi:hypothetical protein